MNTTATHTENLGDYIRSLSNEEMIDFLSRNECERMLAIMKVYNLSFAKDANENDLLQILKKDWTEKINKPHSDIC